MKLRKRIFAAFLAAVMSTSLMVVSVSAQGSEITEAARESITTDATAKEYTTNLKGSKGESVFLGAFQIDASEAKDGTFALHTALPDTYISKETELEFFPGEFYPVKEAWPNFEVCAYAAVLDTDASGVPLPGAEVTYYWVHVDEENKEITGTIPVGAFGSAVMLFQQVQVAGKMDFKPAEGSEIVLENADTDQSINYQATFTTSNVLATAMAEERDRINRDKNTDLHYTLTISLPEGMKIDTRNYTFDSNIFRCTGIEEVSTGEWLCDFEIKLGEWDYQDGVQISYDDIDKLEARLKEPMTLAFSATIPPELTAGGQTLVGSMLLHGWYDSETEWQQFDYHCQSTPAIVQTVSAVTVTPADMTVYMGGDKGYEGVVGEGGSEIKEQNSLPEPLFKISAPSGSGVNPTELTFANTTTGNSWKPELVGTASDGTAYYRLADQKQKDTPIRVQFVDESGKVHESDAFEPTEVDDLYVNYAIKIFSSAKDVVKVATASGQEYAISRNSGTLTVRAVEKEDPTSNIENTAPAAPVTKNSAVAVAPAETTYTINDTDVPVVDAKPSLLFDSIIDDEQHDRTGALEKKVDETLGALDSNTTRHYEIMYLDLVDANNGNAWIKASNNVDIYWGYPEGTDQSTTFKILHFPGLHRDGDDSGYNVSDIESCGVDTSIVSENTPNGIKFSVAPGGFSPFALVWETTSVDPDPGDGGGTGTRDDYTLHYVTNGGKHLSSETKSSSWTKDYEDLPIPVRDGYTFEGWYWDLRLTEPVTGDVKVDKTTVTLYAKWSGGSYGPDDTGVSKWLETDEHNAFLSGYPDGSFQADKNMTRAEVAQMFYSLLLDKSVTITKTFSDVEDDAWYAKAVNTMASLGMLEGYPDGTFRPDAPITRAEFAAIALAFAYDPASASCSYTDVNTSAWYYTYVAQATTYGWIGGYPDGSFRPNNSITRAEVAVIVNNMLSRDADESYIDRNVDELVSFVDLSKNHWAYYTIMEATNTHDYTTSSNGESWK